LGKFSRSGLLIVFGFGTPVAVAGAILMGFGFSALAASGQRIDAMRRLGARHALGNPMVSS
jgi:lactate permease